MKHLYFLRHGLSEFNKAGIWTGDTDSPLAPKGVEQAILAGKNAKLEGFMPDLIIASPLSRALDTAKLFAKEIGYPLEKIITDSNLLERGFGTLEGNINLLAETNYKNNEASIDHIDGVEKLLTLQERADKYLTYLNSLDEYATVLVVGHGAYARALRRSINNDPLSFRGEIIANAKLLKFI